MILSPLSNIKICEMPSPPKNVFYGPPHERVIMANLGIGTHTEYHYIIDFKISIFNIFQIII